MGLLLSGIHSCRDSGDEFYSDVLAVHWGIRTSQGLIKTFEICSANLPLDWTRVFGNSPQALELLPPGRAPGLGFRV